MSKNQHRVIFTMAVRQAARLEKYRAKIGWTGSRGALIRMMIDRTMDAEGVTLDDVDNERVEDEREDAAIDAV